MPRKVSDLMFTAGVAGQPVMSGLWVITGNGCWASCQVSPCGQHLESVMGPVHLSEPLLAVRHSRNAPWFHKLVLAAKRLGYVIRWGSQWPQGEVVRQNQEARKLT